jgi:large subunit ribosomal protein L24
MQKKIHIKKGDTVFVNTGEYKGQQGRVLEVIRKKERALVEGINLVSKHTKPNAKSPQGGILKKEAPVHISNLMLLDPSTGKPTRSRIKVNKEPRVRNSKKTREESK